MDTKYCISFIKLWLYPLQIDAILIENFTETYHHNLLIDLYFSIYLSSFGKTAMAVSLVSEDGPHKPHCIPIEMHTKFTC